MIYNFNSKYPPTKTVEYDIYGNPISTTNNTDMVQYDALGNPIFPNNLSNGTSLPNGNLLSGNLPTTNAGLNALAMVGDANTQKANFDAMIRQDGANLAGRASDTLIGFNIENQKALNDATEKDADLLAQNNARIEDIDKQTTPDTTNGWLNALSGVGNTYSLESALFGLGNALAKPDYTEMDDNAKKRLNQSRLLLGIGSAGKLLVGGSRSLLGGHAYAKREAHVVNDLMYRRRQQMLDNNANAVSAYSSATNNNYRGGVPILADGGYIPEEYEEVANQLVNAGMYSKKDIERYYTNVNRSTSSVANTPVASVAENPVSDNSGGYDDAESLSVAFNRAKSSLKPGESFSYKGITYTVPASVPTKTAKQSAPAQKVVAKAPTPAPQASAPASVPESTPAPTQEVVETPPVVLSKASAPTKSKYLETFGNKEVKTGRDSFLSRRVSLDNGKYTTVGNLVNSMNPNQVFISDNGDRIAYKDVQTNQVVATTADQIKKVLEDKNNIRVDKGQLQDIYDNYVKGNKFDTSKIKDSKNVRSFNVNFNGSDNVTNEVYQRLNSGVFGTYGGGKPIVSPVKDANGNLRYRFNRIGWEVNPADTKQLENVIKKVTGFKDKELVDRVIRLMNDRYRDPFVNKGQANNSQIPLKYIKALGLKSFKDGGVVGKLTPEDVRAAINKN